MSTCGFQIASNEYSLQIRCCAKHLTHLTSFKTHSYPLKWVLFNRAERDIEWLVNLPKFAQLGRLQTWVARFQHS